MRVNSALANTIPIRGFFAFHRTDLDIKSGSLPQKEESIGDHRFTLEQLKLMSQYGDARERAILYTAKDLGLRASDFVRLERKLILPTIERSRQERKDLEFPLEFKVITQKEKVLAVCHLMKETWEILEIYWKANPSKWFFPSGKRNDKHTTEEALNYVLRKLWSEAYRDPEIFETPRGVGKKTSGHLRFHGIRDFLISNMVNAGLNKWAIKLMTGKKVGSDMKEYLSGLDLEELYQQVEPKICLGGLTNHNHSTMSQIRDKMTKHDETLNRLIEGLATLVELKIKERNKETTDQDWKKMMNLHKKLSYYKLKAEEKD